MQGEYAGHMALIRHVCPRETLRCSGMLCDHQNEITFARGLDGQAEQKKSQVFMFIGVDQLPTVRKDTNQGRTLSSHDLDLMRAIVLGHRVSTNEKLWMGSQIIYDNGLTESATFPIQQDSYSYFLDSF